MEQSPKESPKKLRSSSCRLCSGTITSLLSAGREYHIAEHTTIKVG